MTKTPYRESMPLAAVTELLCLLTKTETEKLSSFPQLNSRLFVKFRTNDTSAHSSKCCNTLKYVGFGSNI